MDAPAQYLEELHSELALYPTWFPFDPIAVGEYGRIVRGRFVRAGELAELDITAEPETLATDGNFTRRRGLHFAGGAKVEGSSGLVDLAAGVDLQLARDQAWAFGARGVDTVRIKNLREVGRAVLEAKRAGTWDADWLLVTELRQVAMLNVVVVRSRHSKVRLFGKGTTTLADVLLGADLSFEHASDDVFTVVNHPNSTPLYGLHQLAGFWRPGLEPIAKGGDEVDALERADEVSFGLD